MARKGISDSEYAELLEDGAALHEEAQPMTIERFGELIEKMDALVRASLERAEVETARNQMQLEVLATLQAVIRQNNAAGQKTATIDLEPLQTVLTQIQEANAERGRVAYDFDIKRSGQGYISGIVATPITPTQH